MSCHYNCLISTRNINFTSLTAGSHVDNQVEKPKISLSSALGIYNVQILIFINMD